MIIKLRLALVAALLLVTAACSEGNKHVIYGGWTDINKTHTYEVNGESFTRIEDHVWGCDPVMKNIGGFLNWELAEISYFDSTGKATETIKADRLPEPFRKPSIDEDDYHKALDDHVKSGAEPKLPCKMNK